MESHWNWSSHRLLYIIIEKLKSTRSREMLETFDRKISKQMTLKTIHEKFQSKTTQSKTTPPSGYCQMTAVRNCQKDYPEVTLEEGLDFEEFVFDYLGPIGAHKSSAYEHTPEAPYIQMEWNISTAAVDALYTEAMRHRDEFTKNFFLSLKIGDSVVINELREVSFLAM